MKTREQNAHWQPDVTNMPVSLYERFDDCLLAGAPLTLLSLAAFILAPIVPADRGAFLMNVWFISALLFVPACLVLISAVIPVIAIPLLHPAQRRKEVREWAEHGYYREGFETRGYDTRTLRRVSRASARKARRASAKAAAQRT